MPEMVQQFSRPRFLNARIRSLDETSLIILTIAGNQQTGVWLLPMIRQGLGLKISAFHIVACKINRMPSDFFISSLRKVVDIMPVYIWPPRVSMANELAMRSCWGPRCYDLTRSSEIFSIHNVSMDSRKCSHAPFRRKNFDERWHREPRLQQS